VHRLGPGAPMENSGPARFSSDFPLARSPAQRKPQEPTGGRSRPRGVGRTSERFHKILALEVGTSGQDLPLGRCAGVLDAPDLCNLGSDTRELPGCLPCPPPSSMRTSRSSCAWAVSSCGVRCGRGASPLRPLPPRSASPASTSPNILNGHAPLVEPLAHRLAETADVDPVLLGATIRRPRRLAPARHGFMKGWIVAHGDLTEPMEGWEMLED
jgi:hypothetical protein